MSGDIAHRMGVGDVRIRIAAPGDAAAITPLIDQLGYSVTVDEVESRLAAMEESDQSVVIAEVHGQLVGCLTTSIMRVLHRPAPVGPISMMVVDENSRSKGIGRRLVAAAERLLADKGCQLVEVTSNLRLTDAHRFYEVLGYERTSARFAKEVG